MVLGLFVLNRVYNFASICPKQGLNRPNPSQACVSQNFRKLFVPESDF